MRGYHSGVRRMELSGPAASPQFGGDLVDALRDNQHRPVDRFRQEIPKRPVEAAREHNSFTVLCDDRKGAIKIKNFSGVTSEQPAPSLRFVDHPEALSIFRNKIDDAGNWQVSIHPNKLARARGIFQIVCAPSRSMKLR